MTWWRHRRDRGLADAAADVAQTEAEAHLRRVRGETDRIHVAADALARALSERELIGRVAKVMGRRQALPPT